MNYITSNVPYFKGYAEALTIRESFFTQDSSHHTTENLAFKFYLPGVKTKKTRHGGAMWARC